MIDSFKISCKYKHMTDAEARQVKSKFTGGDYDVRIF